MKRFLIPGLLVVSISLPAFLTGCASSVAKRTSEMSEQMSAQSSTVGNLQRRVDAINVVFNHLESANQPDLRPVLDAYTDEVDKLRAEEKKSNSQYADLLNTRSGYIVDWKTEHKQLSNPTLRAAADASYRQTMANYDTLSNKATGMRSAYNTYITDLDQIQTFLKNDLSRKGIAKIKPVIGKARADGKNLKASAQAYQTSLNEAYNTIPPTYK